MGEVSAIPPGKNPSLLKGFSMRVNSIIERARMSGLFGQSFGGKRDYYETFGWDRDINPDDIWSMYNRGGIAQRVVDAFPEAIWARPPQLYVKDDDKWNADWDGFTAAYDLWSVLRRLDVMVGLGRYACLVIGTDKGQLESPQPKNAKITYLQPYAEKDIRVQSYVTDATDPRFGKPLTYIVYPNKGHNNSNIQGVSSVAPVRSSFVVHHTRVIHVVRNPLENAVFGTPLYAPIWNYLTDLNKVVGSSSESYWLSAFPGLHADIDKEMELETGDEANLTEEIDEYMHSMRRFIRTRGVKVNAINSTIADPRGAFNVLITLIAGTVGIPQRILLGSEAGQLASTQDKGSWAERIEERRDSFCVPYIIMPLMRWINEYSTMKVNLSALQALWPEAYRMSPLERGQQSAQTARTIANIVKLLESPVMGLMQTTTQTTTDPATGQPVETQVPVAPEKPFMTVDELRAIIGLSTDQKILTERPS